MAATARHTAAAAGLVCLWMLAGGALPAAAQGLRRLDAAWLVPEPLAGRVLGGGTEPPATGPWLRAGQARLFGLAELPARRLAVGLAGSRGAWALEGAWETLGSGPLRDDLGEARLQFGGRWRVGVSAGWRRVQAGAGEPWRRWDGSVDAGLGWQDGPLGGGLVRWSWPLGRPEAAPGAGPVKRLLVAWAGGGRALALQVDSDGDGRPHVGWEVLGGLGAHVALSCRADPASGALGGGLLLQRGRLRLRTSHLAHPDLGLTHRCEVAVGAVGASPW